MAGDLRPGDDSLTAHRGLCLRVVDIDCRWRTGWLAPEKPIPEKCPRCGSGVYIELLPDPSAQPDCQCDICQAWDADHGSSEPSYGDLIEPDPGQTRRDD